MGRSERAMIRRNLAAYCVGVSCLLAVQALSVTAQETVVDVSSTQNSTAWQLPEPLAEWEPLIGKILLSVVFCLASSFSPAAVPISLLFSFKPLWLQQLWAYAFENLSDTQIMAGLVPACGFTVYFVHGFICLYFDSIWRPEALEWFKIQKGKQFDLNRVGLVTRNLLINLGPVTWGFALFLAMCKKTGHHRDERDHQRGALLLQPPDVPRQQVALQKHTQAASRTHGTDCPRRDILPSYRNAGL